MTQALDYDWLKANHTIIHYFGLGFIQVKLGDRERVHFYLPDLEPIVSFEDVHNHRYSFSSTILKGQLHQHLFGLVLGDTHVMTIESCDPAKTAPDTQTLCHAELDSVHTYTAGSVYSISHQMFHRVHADFCITQIVRSGYQKEFAEVVRPVGASKVCPFSKQIPEEELWLRIKEVL